MDDELVRAFAKAAAPILFGRELDEDRDPSLPLLTDTSALSWEGEGDQPDQPAAWNDDDGSVYADG